MPSLVRALLRHLALQCTEHIQASPRLGETVVSINPVVPTEEYVATVGDGAVALSSAVILSSLVTIHGVDRVTAGARHCCLCMATVHECVCCCEIEEMAPMLEEANVGCITLHPGFNPVCLNPYVLQTAYYHYRQQHNETISDVNNRYRYTAYRQLARFAWGYLGKEIQVVLPACAVLAIRKTFPSPDGQYIDFLEPE